MKNAERWRFTVSLLRSVVQRVGIRLHKGFQSFVARQRKAKKRGKPQSQSDGATVQTTKLPSQCMRKSKIECARVRSTQGLRPLRSSYQINAEQTLVWASKCSPGFKPARGFNVPPTLRSWLQQLLRPELVRLVNLSFNSAAGHRSLSLVSQPWRVVRLITRSRGCFQLRGLPFYFEGFSFRRLEASRLDFCYKRRI